MGKSPQLRISFFFAGNFVPVLRFYGNIRIFVYIRLFVLCLPPFLPLFPFIHLLFLFNYNDEGKSWIFYYWMGRKFSWVWSPLWQCLLNQIKIQETLEKGYFNTDLSFYYYLKVLTLNEIGFYLYTLQQFLCHLSVFFLLFFLF